jgi:hypothetical protein
MTKKQDASKKTINAIKNTAKSPKTVRITDLKDLPKGAKLKDGGGSIFINDDPSKVDVPWNSSEMQRRLKTMTPSELKRFTETFGTLYIEE